MSTRYLLPCGCGQKVPVGVHQAGLNVTCGCGQVLEVPTRRAVTQLEQEVEASSPAMAGTTVQPGSAAVAGGAWGLRQRLRFLAMVVLIAAGAGWGFLLITWPTDHVGPSIAVANPVEAMEFWQHLRGGIDVRQNVASREFLATIEVYRRWRMVCAGGAAVGLLLVVGSFLAPRPQPAVKRPAT
jgi:hypothetical protein